MTDNATPLPSASRPLTTAEKQRADGIKANYIGQGRKLEAADWCKALGVRSPEEATEIAHLRTINKNAPTAEAMRHAQHGARNFGVAVGLIAGAALMLAAGALWLATYSTNFATYGHEMAITGAVTQQLNPPQRCMPGEHLSDGRVCPGGQQ
jgi:hypothetical protein